MTRRRFYAPPEAFARDQSSVTLGVDETQHLRNVLRLQTGDEVHVFDGAGREFRGEIAALTRDQSEIRLVQEVAPTAAESPLHLTLAVALLKGEKFDLVVQKLTELGVNRIVPIATNRADVRIRNDNEASRKLTRWQRIALEATKQCGRARLMSVDHPISFAEFIDATRSGFRLMFAESGGGSFADAIEEFDQGTDGITALIGSEGGWTNDEIDLARTNGWRIITLPGRIMRAETATITCAALLQHRFGDLV